MNGMLRAGLICAFGAAVTLSGCLNMGCAWMMSDDAKRVFGFYEPGIHVSHGLLGTDVSVDSDFTGKFDALYNPETGQFEAHAQVDSAATPILEAQAKRIAEENFLAVTQANWTGRIGFQKQLGENIGTTFAGIAQALEAAGTWIPGLQISAGGVTTTLPQECPWSELLKGAVKKATEPTPEAG